MFGNNLKNINQMQSTPALAEQSPREYGVGSALKELIDTSESLIQNAANLRSTLGISFPDEVTGAAQPTSLVDAIAMVTARVRKATLDLQDANRYINS